ncbi:MAG: tetratricopeptide repeat protein, partial [Blastocatellia bacterium]
MTSDGPPLVNIRAQEEAVTSLDPGKPIERELSRGQEHSYRLSLAAGEYLRVVVEQRGINVGVAIFAPDGKQITEIDNSNDPKGVEEVLLIAEVAGAYQLKVRAVEKEKATGRYEISVKEQRPATAQDGAVFANWLLRQVARLRGARQYDAAMPLARRALAISEQRLQPDAPELLPFLNSLVLVYRDKGEYAQVEPLFERALKITEKQK